MNNANSSPKSIFGISSASIGASQYRPQPSIDSAVEQQLSWTLDHPRSLFRRPPLPQRSTSLPQSLSDKAERVSEAGPSRIESRKRPAAEVEEEIGSPVPPAPSSSSPPHQHPHPLHKRRKLHSHHRHALEHFDFDFPPNPSSPNQPPSPLFFSHSTTRARPALPPRFSSSEAGARMLSSTHGEDSGIKTVTLARGSIASPSLDGLLLPRSASPEDERHDGSSGGSGAAKVLLDELGITELLEQDGRPTFIVDLLDVANMGPGPAKLVFVNPALRSNHSWMELISGKAIDPGGTTPGTEPGEKPRYPQFKSWLLGATEQGRSLDVSPPLFLYGEMTWSCSTIRKRFRVVSASLYSANLSSRATSTAPTSSPYLNSHRRGPSDDRLPTIASAARAQEPNDYFGNAPTARGSAPPDIPTSHPRKDGQSTSVHQANSRPHAAGLGHSSRTNSGDQRRLADSRNFESPSLANESILSAASTSSVDPFSITPTTARQSRHPSPSSMQVPSPHTEPQGFFDWTQLPLSDDLPPHIRFARTIDWGATALGPIDTWSPDLRQMCNLIMASPHPAAMYWGDDLVAIYNEAYVLLAGQKHPNLMGQSYREAWAEIWDEVKDVFASARLTGEATMKDDDCLFIKRSDYLEETYFSWSIIPMVGGDGTVAGLYNPAFEKTRRKIAERRMLTLREVGERTATARDVKGFWEQVTTALWSNEFDTPFVLCYSVSDENDSDSSSVHSNSLMGGKQCYLEGSLGVPTGHPAAPAQIDLKAGKEGFGAVFREVMKLDKPVLLDISYEDTTTTGTHLDNSAMQPSSDGGSLPHTGNGQIPSSMLEGLEWRGFGDPCRSVVVCPVHPTTGEAILGFLVLGVNPRRPYDDDYHLFVQLLSRQLATSLASVVLFEEEIRRGQRAAKLAALDRIELSEQLAARTQEAKDIELRFTRMAEFSPAGLFIANSEGHITYCNDTWYEITRVPKNARDTGRWMDIVMEEDQPLVRKSWDNLITKIEPISLEFRFKAPWEDRNGNRSDTWVLFSAYPEKYTEDVGATVDDNGRVQTGRKEGSLKSVFGSVTNISQQKWAEGWQKRKMEEAVELKRQQENFIDITSHEMRNPLSAILQCADDIYSSWSDYRQHNSAQTVDQLIEANVENAQTITLCAQHQKRIVDDVLTLSKLDSAMLMVTPVDVRPVDVAQRALKMFEGEVVTASIDMQFVIDKSFHEHGVDWVRIDPSRVLQVLINLTTNAIKFTSSELGQKGRKITVTIGASLTNPSDLPPDRRRVDYVQPRNKRLDMTAGQDWGDGEQIYIVFAVQDTGRGLTDQEKKMLFLRFSQASPRTHVQYGGSGLGLFISRELTELQGGRIGVASEAGKGSTFAFYVKARKSQASSDVDAGLPPSLRSTNLDTQRKTSTGALSAIKSRDFAAGGAMPTVSQSPKQKRRNGEVKVLIVEDNLVNQRVLQKQLANLGFDVAVANHGGEALEAVRSSTHWAANLAPSPNGTGRSQVARDGLKLNDVHVILMDQEMPVMDGMQCTKRIRYYEQQGEVVRHIPIIGVTANARQGQIEQLKEAGMDDVVSKPFRIPELVPKIEELATKYAWEEPPSEANGPIKA